MNELYAARTFLSYNNTWSIIPFSNYLAKLESWMIEATYPHSAGHCGCNGAEGPV
jgi:hypothetical protein